MVKIILFGLLSSMCVWGGDEVFTIPWEHRHCDSLGSGTFRASMPPADLEGLRINCYDEGQANIVMRTACDDVVFRVRRCGVEEPGCVLSLKSWLDDSESFFTNNVFVGRPDFESVNLTFVSAQRGVNSRTIEIDVAGVVQWCGGSTLFFVTKTGVVVTRMLGFYNVDQREAFVQACFSYKDFTQAVVQWGVRSNLGVENVLGDHTFSLVKKALPLKEL